MEQELLTLPKQLSSPSILSENRVARCLVFCVMFFLDQKTKDQATRNPLQTGDKLRCSGRVGSSCSTSDTRCVMLIKNPMISHEWGKDKERYYLEPFKKEACEQHLT